MLIFDFDICFIEHNCVSMEQITLLDFMELYILQYGSISYATSLTKNVRGIINGSKTFSDRICDDIYCGDC